MNWGKGIIIGMLAFMIYILALGIRMISNPTDDYDHDYYEKGLTFNAEYNKEKQVDIDHAQPQISIDNKIITARFKTLASGKIRFQRPADRRLDKMLNFKSDENGLFTTNLNLAADGRWQIICDWESNGKKYLYQQEIWVQ